MEARHVLSLHDLRERWWRPAVVLLLVAMAIVWRLVRADAGAPPNLELVTAATFAGALLLRNRLAFAVPLVVAVVSDLLLGNGPVWIFTWSAWAVVGLGALLAPRFADRHRFWTALGFGAGASVWFYLWTNAGVWLLARGTFYPAGIEGLAASYVAGLPFLRTMLIGNLVLVPVAAAVVSLVESFERRRELGMAPALGATR
ncbi:hypothetical protein GCM10025865_26500 [Paraoerskovia sediminicola]|uniref:Energy-coupling factor transport system substrate-specific component n=1 Tax=Paraoerskovia sediminicola TaxID=1138587 RepID=A0ABM8G5H6_9CELL|nr:DUF6580 family putative transport protein [Paraoerskovia sediminicola]BDZ43351.1 hypothetical protein GCM10025865_26500 [Paraoerskovia sediminicola]